MLDALSTPEMVEFINTTQGEAEEEKVEKLKMLYLARA
jgi:hypothetical protein